MMNMAPDTCPGLRIKNGRLIFTDVLTSEHDLLTQPLLNTFEASKEMRCHPETLLRMIRGGEIYPVLYINPRVIQIYRCALDDFRARKTMGFREAKS